MSTSEMSPKKATKQLFDEQVAKRFLTFRETYIDKSQNKAAKMLGLAQSILSYIESGQRAPSLMTMDKMIKNFKLNAEWLATGKGSPIEKNPAKNTLVTDIAALNDEIRTLRKQVKVLEVNQNHLIHRLERLENKLDGK